MKIKIRYILLSMAFFLMASFIGYYILIDLTLEEVRTPIGSSYNSESGFLINPGTFLSDLYNGKPDLFFPLPATPEAQTQNGFPPTNYYSWTQSDFLAASVALHRFVWNDNLRNWRLFSMIFGAYCHDGRTGFDSASITYFKLANYEIDQDLFDYTTHELEISPMGSTVGWGGDAFFHRPLLGWKHIVPEKMKIDANKALQIAEENGGKEFRQGVDNECTIVVSLNPNTKETDNWQVWYYPLYVSGGFDIEINPYTGKYTIAIAETEDSPSP